MFFSEHNRIVTAIPASASSGATGQLIGGQYVKMKDYDHMTIIVTLGDCSSACRIMVQEDADGSGAGTARTINYASLASGASTLGTPTTAASTGIVTEEATDDGKAYVIELDSADLTSGYPYVRVVVGCSAAVAGVNPINATYILSRGRFAAAGAIA